MQFSATQAGSCFPDMLPLRIFLTWTSAFFIALWVILNFAGRHSPESIARKALPEKHCPRNISNRATESVTQKTCSTNIKREFQYAKTTLEKVDGKRL